MTIPYYDIEYDADGEPVRMYWCGFGPSLKETIMSWRKKAASVISKVIAETGSEELHLLKDRRCPAYPFGVRAFYPYKVWCLEIQRQLGTTPPLQHGGRKPEQVPEEQGR